MYRGPVVKRAGPNNKRNDNVVHRERDIRVTRWAVISYVKLRHCNRCPRIVTRVFHTSPLPVPGRPRFYHTLLLGRDNAQRRLSSRVSPTILNDRGPALQASLSRLSWNENEAFESFFRNETPLLSLLCLNEP